MSIVEDAEINEEEQENQQFIEDIRKQERIWIDQRHPKERSSWEEKGLIVSNISLYGEILFLKLKLKKAVLMDNFTIEQAQSYFDFVLKKWTCFDLIFLSKISTNNMDFEGMALIVRKDDGFSFSLFFSFFFFLFSFFFFSFSFFFLNFNKNT